MIVLATLLVAHAFECRAYSLDDLPVVPPLDAQDLGSVDLPDMAFVRLSEGHIASGFSYQDLLDALVKATTDRGTVYDYAVMTHTEALPDQFDTAAAFNIGLNTVESGTGKEPVESPYAVRDLLWLNHLDYWDPWGDELAQWVFAHEFGHNWLAFAEYETETGEPSDQLLGRQRAHWSYFFDTPNSPMEGNAWVDNGDGTFTTDLDVPRAYAPLDLYMMGFIPKEDVPPFFLIEDAQVANRTRESGPEHVYYDEPVTVTGTRRDLTVDDVIAVVGERNPSEMTSQRDFRILTILVVGPEELIEPEVIERVYERQALWRSGYESYAGGYASVDFSMADDGLSPPPEPYEPALLPRSAW